MFYQLIHIAVIWMYLMFSTKIYFTNFYINLVSSLIPGALPPPDRDTSKQRRQVWRRGTVRSWSQVKGCPGSVGQWLQEICCETQRSGCLPTMAVLPTITLVVAQTETWLKFYHVVGMLYDVLWSLQQLTHNSKILVHIHVHPVLCSYIVVFNKFLFPPFFE